MSQEQKAKLDELREKYLRLDYLFTQEERSEFLELLALEEDELAELEAQALDQIEV